MSSPVRIAVTGAAGSISYSLLFRIAAGEMFGPDTPVELQLLEITPAMEALEGVAMEIDDCAFPLLEKMTLTDDPKQGFDGANVAVLVGGKPRDASMERADLIRGNGPIFTKQGEALNEVAADDIRVAVVANPCNTNALITMNNAPDIPDERFTAMTRLDENRAKSQLATKADVPVKSVTNMGIWGNHSATMYPDFFNAQIDGAPVTDSIDEGWLRDQFIPTVQGRGSAIIEARGQSSAASAANAALDHVRSWFSETPDDDWHAMAIPSTGDYGVSEGLIFSLPVRCDGEGNYDVVDDIDLNEFAREKIETTEAELLEEREVVQDLI